MAKDFSTILSTATIKRDNHQSPITETDLENYIVESVWKVFDKFRLEIASKSGISEFDLALRDARIMGFKVDGHKVSNPEGFTGKTIEVLTLVTIGKHGLEEGVLRAHIARDKSQVKSLLYIEAGDSMTSIFAATPDKAHRIGEVNWGKDNILSAISEFFQIEKDDKAEAIKIYKRFVNGELSPYIFLKLESIFKSSFRNFAVELSNIVNSVKGLKLASIESIFIDTFAIPDSLCAKKFLFDGKRAKIIRRDESAHGNHSVTEFLDDKDKSYKRYNDIAKVRMKWIGAPN